LKKTEERTRGNQKDVGKDRDFHVESPKAQCKPCAKRKNCMCMLIVQKKKERRSGEGGSGESKNKQKRSP